MINKRTTYVPLAENISETMFTVSQKSHKEVRVFLKNISNPATATLSPAELRRAQTVRTSKHAVLTSMGIVLGIAFAPVTTAAADTVPEFDILMVEHSIVGAQSLTVSPLVAPAAVARESFTATSVEELAAINAAEAEAARVAAEQASISVAAASVNPVNNAGVAGNQIFAADSIISAAQQWVGTVPYGSGNNPSDSFSCDGYVQYVFAQNGISLPRGVGAQAAMGTQISASEAKAGDLLVWPGQHIAIYDGNGGMYDSPMPGRYVQHRTSLWGNPIFIRL